MFIELRMSLRERIKQPVNNRGREESDTPFNTSPLQENLTVGYLYKFNEIPWYQARWRKQGSGKVSGGKHGRLDESGVTINLKVTGLFWLSIMKGPMNWGISFLQGRHSWMFLLESYSFCLCLYDGV